MFDGFFYLINNIFLFSSAVDSGNSFPQPLSAEDERKYLELFKDGDMDARDKLVHHNMRLVVHIAKKYGNYPDSDELISVGAIGLIKAINTYSLGKGTHLATYAARCIENEILMIMRLNKKHSKNISLYDSIGMDKEGNEMTFIDLISQDENDIIESVEKDMIKEKLLEIIKNILTTREYEIIKLRYGLVNNTPLTQKEVAAMYDISRSYVSRIESKAIKKVRNYMIKEEMYY